MLQSSPVCSVIILLDASDAASDNVAFRVGEIVHLVIIETVDVAGNGRSEVLAVNLGRIH